MVDQIGPNFLMILAAVFGFYGIQELGAAYRTIPMNEWWDRALPSAGGLILAVLFIAVALRVGG